MQSKMLPPLRLYTIFALHVSKSADIDTLSKEELILQVRSFQDQVVDFQHQLAVLQKMVFGPTSERFKLTEAPANQLSLDVAGEPLAQVEIKKTTIKEHDRTKVKLEAKKYPGRVALPSGLRREEIKNCKQDLWTPQWGNNVTPERLDINRSDLLAELEKKFLENPPNDKETDMYGFMTIVTILHEYVHSASKRTNYRLSRGWGSDGHDEASNWEWDTFGRYIDYPTQKSMLSWAKHPDKVKDYSVESYMQSDPSMGMFIVIQSPASNMTKSKKKPDADAEAKKKSV